MYTCLYHVVYACLAVISNLYIPSFGRPSMRRSVLRIHRCGLCDGDAKLAKVLLIPHVLIGLLGFLELELPLVNHGMDIACLYGLVHGFEL